MYVYQSTNPCVCTVSNPVVDPPCPEECNCIKLCNIAVNALSNNAVFPCGAEGTVDLTTADHDLCACGSNEGYWSVESFDSEIFATATASAIGGLLTYTTQGIESLQKQYGKIIIKYQCGTLSAYLTVLIGVKDPCYNKYCGSEFICNQCNGECDTNPDLVVNPEPGPDLNVNNGQGPELQIT